MSDYDVEEYIQPTIKRNTYEKDDDNYLSEKSESGSESGSDKSENSDEEINDIGKEKEGSPIVQRKCSIEVESQLQARTNNRFILHISNLSEDTTKNMIEDFFGDAGELKAVRIPKKRGKSNFAFVEMKSVEGLKNALSFDGKELDGKPIYVQQGSKNKKHTSGKRNKRKAPRNNNKNEADLKKKRFK